MGIPLWELFFWKLAKSRLRATSRITAPSTPRLFKTSKYVAVVTKGTSSDFELANCSIVSTVTDWSGL